MTLGIQCVLAVLPALSHLEEGSASHLLNRVSLILSQFRAGTSCEAWPMTHESSEDSPTDLHLAVNQGFNDSIFFRSFHVFNLLFLFSYQISRIHLLKLNTVTWGLKRSGAEQISFLQMEALKQQGIITYKCKNDQVTDRILSAWSLHDANRRSTCPWTLLAAPRNDLNKIS